MIEIEFRGKRPDWGKMDDFVTPIQSTEWVYGDLIQDPFHAMDECQFSKEENPYLFSTIMPNNGIPVTVIAETIGQYTGLKDKNGKKIFDGDIIKWDDDSNGKYWRVAVVKISPDLQFECFDCPLIKNSSAHGHVFHFGNFIYQDTEKWIEIIGNLNDNPELLR